MPAHSTSILAARGYFEAGGGYRITATVGTNLNVSVSEELR